MTSRTRLEAYEYGFGGRDITSDTMEDDHRSHKSQFQASGTFTYPSLPAYVPMVVSDTIYSEMVLCRTKQIALIGIQSRKPSRMIVGFATGSDRADTGLSP